MSSDGVEESTKVGQSRSDDEEQAACLNMSCHTPSSISAASVVVHQCIIRFYLHACSD